MAFSVKDWKDGAAGKTPITAAALEDVEKRLSDYVQAPDEPVEINAGFTNSFDTSLWIAGAPRESPTVQSQGLYIQHRVSGNLNAKVQDAAASELRLSAATNTAGSSAHEASLVVSGGANTISTLYGVLANFKTAGEPTGTITNVRLISAQTVETLAAGLTIENLYSLFVPSQSKGTNNYSLYVNGGNSVIRGVIRPSSTAENGLTIRGLEGQVNSHFAIQNSATTTLFLVTAAGSVRIGSGLATTATDGFLYLPSSNGVPTGVPTSQTGTIACQYDRANNKLYIYNGGWKSVELA